MQDGHCSPNSAATRRARTRPGRSPASPARPLKNDGVAHARIVGRAKGAPRSPKLPSDGAALAHGEGARPHAAVRVQDGDVDLGRRRSTPAMARQQRHGRVQPDEGRQLFRDKHAPQVGARATRGLACAHAPRGAAGRGARQARRLTEEAGRAVGGRARVRGAARCEAVLQPGAVCGRPSRPPQIRRRASPRRGRGRQADHGAAAAARPLTRGIGTLGGRWPARPGGWTRRRRTRSCWQAGAGGRAGGGDRAGARAPPLPARCSAAQRPHHPVRPRGSGPAIAAPTGGLLELNAPQVAHTPPVDYTETIGGAPRAHSTAAAALTVPPLHAVAAHPALPVHELRMGPPAFCEAQDEAWRGGGGGGGALAARCRSPQRSLPPSISAPGPG